MTERTHESDLTPAARLERESLSRFELLKQGGITGLVLAGAPTVVGALAGTSGAARRPAAKPQAPTPTGTVDFFSWEGYDFPNKYVPTMAAWKKKYGLKLKSTYIGNHDDIQA